VSDTARGFGRGQYRLNRSANPDAPTPTGTEGHEQELAYKASTPGEPVSNLAEYLTLTRPTQLPDVQSVVPNKDRSDVTIEKILSYVLGNHGFIRFNQVKVAWPHLCRDLKANVQQLA
jgi:hypothetical protein